MDLQPYVERVRHELSAVAAMGGAESEELAGRLSAALESSVRLALLEALADAAEHITRELAPGSVDVRLHGRDPHFTVSAVPQQEPASVPAMDTDEDGGTWRVTLRLPAGLRSGVDAAAGREGLSVNAWLVRAVSAALGASAPRRTRTPSDTHVSGWVR
ncbi:histidine kinase [Mycolicibacterium sp. S2-37]|uniref:histidine kinase n=1 Tax=Mycolicibacterium sp. S2-37 TaxID=2810297 RepID=UPI001A944580|nr:histidine kinase [Mycolicibacterium sp. S2-37]MBO0677051.1 histidine kinase [Mycolicibacterium sp. S2-37]